jgi:hypothetical protein
MHQHEPSEYAVNLNAAGNVDESPAPLWCDECGETIEYRGTRPDGSLDFGSRPHRYGEGTFCQPRPLNLPA